MTRLGIVFVIIELHHLREVDIAPLNWNVFIGNLSRGAWNMFFLVPLFDWVEITSVFPKSCWSKRLQALCDMLCLDQGRSSKLKERRYLLTNHRKMIMCREHLRIAPKETHTVNNRCHSFSVLLTQQAYWYVWAKFFLWVKSQFRKRFFFLWRITQTCQSQICFRELMKAKFERKMIWKGKTWCNRINICSRAKPYRRSYKWQGNFPISVFVFS